MNVKEARLQFFEKVYPNISNVGTRSEYKKPILLYLDWLEENGLEPLPYDPNPREQDIKLYNQLNAFFNDKEFLIGNMERLKGDDISISYLYVMYSAIKLFYEKLFYIRLERRFIDFKGLKSTHKPQILTQEEVDTLLTSEEDLVRSTMIKVGYHCALRASELVLLKVTDYDNGVLRIRVAKTRGRIKEKFIELPPDLQEVIEYLVETERNYLFKKEVDEPYRGITRRRWLPGEWSVWFSKYSQKVLGKRVRWHDFARHTRLTFYAERPDTDFKDVLLLSGHVNPASCIIYFERARHKVKDIIEPKVKPKGL